MEYSSELVGHTVVSWKYKLEGAAAFASLAYARLVDLLIARSLRFASMGGTHFPFDKQQKI